jgi:hypothetical protein
MKQLKIKECMAHSEAVTATFIDGLFIIRKFVACIEQKEQWKWIVNNELIGCVYKNNALFLSTIVKWQQKSEQ